MEDQDYIPRLSVEITVEQKEALDRLVPWGTRRRVFSVIVDDLISILEKSPYVLGAIIARDIKLKSYLKTEEDANR